MEKERFENSWILPGRNCWVELQTSQIFHSAKIDKLNENLKKALIHYEIEKDNEINPKEIDFSHLLERNNDPNIIYEDMVNMDCLNEAELLSNLKKRYDKDQIFTYIGPTLLIINPYKQIKQYFNLESLEKYQKQVNSNEVYNQKENEPHVYAISAKAYHQLIKHIKNQAIVISGESGAGKTENAKYAMKFLTSISHSSDIQKETPIEERILGCNPILEAFGNAKTVRNDNSSRFGKYVCILVEHKERKIKGAAITNYLLEKSRVTTQSIGERNYHIFYHLLQSKDKTLLEELGLFGKEFNFFNYLKLSECFEVSTINDFALWNEVNEAMEKIGFTKKEQNAVYRILASVLLLGNIEFDDKNYNDNNPCEILGDQILKKICQLLEIKIENLKQGLIYKLREIAKQIIISPVNKEESITMRDSFSKALYEKLFNWLVKRLNLSILPKEKDLTLTKSVRKSIKIVRKSIVAKDTTQRLSLGLLDIFGFENFKTNSFEQMCINFTNEKLQQLYISYVFKAEEAEFVEQGLKEHLYRLSYEDNQPIIDLIDKYPLGIFDLVDESCSLGSGTDDALLQKISKTHKECTKLLMPKSQRNTFSIVHTAKIVEYNILGFRAKNKDFLCKELDTAIIESSSNEIKNIWLNICEGENSSSPIKKAEKSLCAKFRGQMKELMTELNSCDVSFIRCIKPNELKLKDNFQHDFTLLQIRYLGVLESIKVRKDGFPFRKEYKQFALDYSELAKTNLKKKEPKDICNFIINKILGEDKSKALMGKTKVYMKQETGSLLDKMMLELWKKKIIVTKKIVKQIKHYIMKKNIKNNLKKIKKIIKKFVRIQAFCRRKIQRKKFISKKKAAHLIFKYLQKKKMKKTIKKLHDQIILIRKWALKKQAAIRLFTIFKKTYKKFFLLKYRNKIKMKKIQINQFEAKRLEQIKIAEIKEKDRLEQIAKEKIEYEKNKKIQEEIEFEKNKKKELEEKLEKEKKKVKFNEKKEEEKNSIIQEKNDEKPKQEKDNEKPKQEKNDEKPQMKKLFQNTIISNEIHLKILGVSIPINSYPQTNWPINTNLNFSLSFPKKSFPSALSIYLISPQNNYSQIIKSIQFSYDKLEDYYEIDPLLLDSISKHNFINFVEPLLIEKTTWNGKKIDSIQRMSYQKNDNNIPLLKHNKEDIEKSKKIFSLINKIIVTKNEEEFLFNSMKVILEGFAGSAILKDEIYLQIIKQLNFNDDKNQRKKLYQLLSLIGSSFPISLMGYFAVLSFLFEAGNKINKLENDEELKGFARFCFRRIQKCFEKKGKKQPPLEHELKAIILMKKILIQLYFSNGKGIFLTIESDSIMKDVIKTVCEKMDIMYLDKFLGITLCEYKENDIIRQEFLKEDESIIEKITEIEYKMMKEESKKNKLSYKFIIRFKLSISIDINIHPEVLELIYYDMLFDYLQGKYNCNLDDIQQLSSWILYIEKGSYSPDKVLANETFDDNLQINLQIEKYIPMKFISKDWPKHYYLVKLLGRYMGMKEESREQIKLNFIHFFKKFDGFMGRDFKLKILKSVLRGESIKEEGVFQDGEITVKPFLLVILEGYFPLYLNIYFLKDKIKKSVYHFKEINKFGLCFEKKNIFILTNDNNLFLFDGNMIQELFEIINGYFNLIKID